MLTHGPRAATGTVLQSEQKVERISKRNFRRRSKIPEVIFFLVWSLWRQTEKSHIFSVCESKDWIYTYVRSTQMGLLHNLFPRESGLSVYTCLWSFLLSENRKRVQESSKGNTAKIYNWSQFDIRQTRRPFTLHIINRLCILSSIEEGIWLSSTSYSYQTESNTWAMPTLLVLLCCISEVDKGKNRFACSCFCSSAFLSLTF